MVYVPPGFAHGYQALTAGAEVTYQSSAEYAPALEGRVRYDDPRVGIAWPIADAVRLSNLSDPEKAVWLAAVDQNTSTGSSE